MLQLLTFIIVASLITYRITRLLITDTIIDTPRIWFHQILLGKTGKFRMWFYELITCKFCLSVWIAAATVAVLNIWLPVQAPVAMWPAVAAGSLLVWKNAE